MSFVCHSHANYHRLSYRLVVVAHGERIAAIDQEGVVHAWVVVVVDGAREEHPVHLEGGRPLHKFALDQKRVQGLQHVRLLRVIHTSERVILTSDRVIHTSERVFYTSERVIHTSERVRHA